MVNSAEDRLKSFLYAEIARLNPELYEQDPQKYFKLCREMYERERYGLLSKKSEPHIQTFTLEEYLHPLLRHIARGYRKSSPAEKREKDGKVFNLLRKCCASIEAAKPHYKIYRTARESS